MGNHQILLYLFCLIFGIWGLTRTIRQPDRTSVILAIAGVAIVIGLYKYGNQQQDPILAAHYDGDINGLTFQFYEDGTYKLHDYSIFGGDVIRGTYEQRGDTITLSELYPLGEDRNFLTNKLLVGDSTMVIVNSGGESEWPIFRITFEQGGR